METILKEKKSIDRELFTSGLSAGMLWSFAGLWTAMDFVMVVLDSWNNYHAHGASFRLFFTPLVYVLPVTNFLGFRRYLHSARSEGLITERIARNCDYSLAALCFAVYFAISFIALNR
jgi:hypothetical protein